MMNLDRIDEIRMKNGKLLVRVEGVMIDTFIDIEDFKEWCKKDFENRINDILLDKQAAILVQWFIDNCIHIYCGVCPLYDIPINGVSRGCDFVTKESIECVKEWFRKLAKEYEDD